MTLNKIKQVAAAIPIHKDGKVLLHHRDDFDWIPHPNTWSCFGGAVEEGETPKQAMIREIKEEIDFDVTSFQHFLSHNHFSSQSISGCIMHVYLIYIDKDISELTLSEGQDFGYFDFEDCFKKNLSAPARLAFDMLRQYKEFRDSFNLPLIEENISHELLPAAGAFPINTKDEILLQHRDDKPEIASPNLWSSFGGRSEKGETLEVAMLRELEEEIEFQPDNYLPFVSVCKGYQNTQFFITNIDVGLDNLVQHEGQGMGFFSLEESFSLDLAFTVRKALEMLKLYKNYCLEHNLKML